MRHSRSQFIHATNTGQLCSRRILGTGDIAVNKVPALRIFYSNWVGADSKHICSSRANEVQQRKSKVRVRRGSFL